MWTGTIGLAFGDFSDDGHASETMTDSRELELSYGLEEKVEALTNVDWVWRIKFNTRSVRGNWFQWKGEQSYSCRYKEWNGADERQK